MIITSEVLATCVRQQILSPPYYSQRAVFASPLSTFFIIDCVIFIYLCVLSLGCSCYVVSTSASD